MTPSNVFSAAVVQATPLAFDVDGTLEKVARLTSDAAGMGARLVVFPEAFVSCYPRGLDFGTAIGARTPEGRAWFRRYWESSIDVPGPAVERIGAIAAQHAVHLVIGVVERAAGTLYCTSLIFAPSGEFLGKHRKLVPTGAERLVWGSGDGSTMPVFDTSVGRLGTVTCWENYMPLLRMSMYAKGIQVWCAPTADSRDTWIASMRHIACEGRCFVLSANQFTRRGDYPDDYPLIADLQPGDVMCRGASMIVSPLGEVLAGPALEGEQILVAELDLAQIVEAKYDFDVVGHYSRPDIFTLVVNESATEPVITRSSHPHVPSS
ncbi:nitrilase [Jatrophihabitans telluris]|uniref:Nitrilase n=1 Tax=Jatrophihabitans telluris TaxID=2038343 RepID=A0ABY4R1B4_9ACTN|nr:nitrilase-related carbon-nitrogen hydrolase [Jatrophihabitans telluris]UQX89297.1 nitrilase [Jatrophihabitans telluris]